MDAALNGHQGFVTAIDATTSGGGVMEKGRWVPCPRDDFIRRVGDRLIPLPKLNERLSQIRISTDYVPDVANCLKTERLPLAKAFAGKSRIFSIIEFPLLVHVRHYSVPLLVYFGTYMHETGVLSGINPHSRDFDLLARHLYIDHTTSYIDGDYGGFDYCIPEAVGEAVYSWLAALFPPHHGREIHRIGRLLTHNRNFLSEYSYERRTGNCTGQPLTLLYNCLANRLLMYSAIYEFCLQKELPFPRATPTEILQHIHDNVRDVYFGDDHIVSRTDRLPITPDDLGKIFAKWDIEYTSTSKTTEYTLKQDIQEVSFLKRTFWRNNNGTIVALLEPRVIFESLLWYNVQKLPLPEIINAVLESMRTEIVLYGTPAHIFYETYINYIYTFELRFPKPQYDYVQRCLDINISSSTTPDSFFEEFVKFHNSLRPTTRESLYTDLRENLPSTIRSQFDLAVSKNPPVL